MEKIHNTRAEVVAYLIKTSDKYAQLEKECREDRLAFTADEFRSIQYGLMIALDVLQNHTKIYV